MKAMMGNRTICPTIPTITVFGFFITLVNAFLSKSMPKRNINIIKIGITIHIVFIVFSFFCDCKNNFFLSYIQMCILNGFYRVMFCHAELIIRGFFCC